jgi:alkylation response protein AidB-like acyl-CoA dehydrogenase
VPIGVSEEHQELARSARRWIEQHCDPAVPRALLDADDEDPGPFWAELAAQGWLGLHLPEELGGQGFGLLELAVVLEELGRAVAPGPFLPTALAAALVARGAEDAEAKVLVPRLAAGECPAAVALSAPAGPVLARPAPERPGGPGADEDDFELTGQLPAVLSAGTAALLVLPAETEDGTAWFAVDLGEAGAERPPGVTVNRRPSLDPTRRTAEVRLEKARVPSRRVLSGVGADDVAVVALVLAAAELTGSARWCLEAGAEHARTRIQFGRPIGQFQGVKHKLADLLCLVEQMTATAWDGAAALDAAGWAGLDPADEAGVDPGAAPAAALAARAAGALALDGAVRVAEDTIQVLGGMGFTWEHDAHLHLRRAASLRQLLGGSRGQRVAVADLALSGVRRRLAVELPPEAAALRSELEPLVADLEGADATTLRQGLGSRGLLFPHWPRPYGRDAGPVEQLVIDQLLAEHGIRRPPAHVMAWALPTVIAHGSADQRERWVGPTLAGRILWCQLFSEPGAGSDLASLRTRAERVEGGWRLEGQKVWTSVAARADLGICLARTDPEAERHAGITYFVVDMRAEGLEVRPLREITGDALFNEVFFNGVFVPDEDVVGPVHGGWALARTTLANERVSLAGDSAFGGGLEAVLAAEGAAERGEADREALGRLLIEAQSLADLGLRSTLRSVSGLEPGPEASVRKLLGAEHDQRVAAEGLGLLGPEGACTDGASAHWARQFLHVRCLTIAGGTSEVQRNVIGERLLGLPRDPEPPRS